MKKMVRNEDAFTQRFRTTKVVRIRFFFGMAPKPEKSESGSISWKHGTAKISGPYRNIFMGPFFFSVNEALGYIHIILDSFSWHGYPVWYKQLLYGPGFLICYVAFLLNEEKKLKS